MLLPNQSLQKFEHHRRPDWATAGNDLSRFSNSSVVRSNFKVVNPCSQVKQYILLIREVSSKAKCSS